MEKEKDFDLKSEQMNEMLSDPPKWIIRSGSGVLLIIIIVVFTFTWFIRYPDEISGEILVSTDKPPIEFSNQGYIQLKSLNVDENDQVKRGDLIAQFDVQANANDIVSIVAYLKKLELLGKPFKQIPVFENSVHLGLYQEQWTKLFAQIENWNQENKSGYTNKEIASIQNEIKLREQLQAISEKRILLSTEEYNLLKKELASSERLAEQNAISKQSLVQDKRANSQAEQNVQSQKEQKVQNLISLNSLRNQLLKLEHETWLTKNQKETEIRTSIATLQSSLYNWGQNSIWVAPCSGKVLFNKILQVNRFYQTNEASVIIVPQGSMYSAIATISADGAGKVKSGQKVIIELIDYPQNEFGRLEGKVVNITQIDKKGKYEVKISLPKQLTTTYNKHIPFKAQFKGTAKILTKEKRLLTRFFEQLTSMLK